MIMMKSVAAEMIEHAISEGATALELHETITKHVIAEAQGLYDLDVLKFVDRDDDWCGTGTGKPVLEAEVERLQERAGQEVSYGLGGPDCGPIVWGGPVVTGPIGGGGTCPGMGPELLESVGLEAMQIEAGIGMP